MSSRRGAFLSLKNIQILILSAILAVGVIGCGKDSSTGAHSDESAAQAVKKENDLSTFSQVMAKAGLESKLQSDGSYTIFAPTDDAFSKLPDGFIDSLSSDQLKEILNYHILSKEMYKSDIRKESSLKTSEGDSIFIKVGSKIELNHNAKVIDGDNEVSNGVIQKVDHVIIPDSYLTVFGVIHKRYQLDKFACHCTSGRTNLDDVLQSKGSEFTVFAPTNTAFDNFDQNVDDLSDSELKHILNYHIVDKKITSDELTNGETLTTRNGEDITIFVDADGTISINGGQANVKQVDLEGMNGVVYIIDSVLNPH